MKTCFIAGNKPKDFPWDYSDTKSFSFQEYSEETACRIDTLICRENFTRFISDGSIGASLDLAEIVIGLRDKFYDGVTLVLALSKSDENIKLSPEDKKRYKTVKEKADEIILTYKNFPFPKYRYIIDKSDLVLVFWNGKKSGRIWNIIFYARKTNKPLAVFDLNDYLEDR